MLCKVTYSQVAGIRAWISLGQQGSDITFLGGCAVQDSAIKCIRGLRARKLSGVRIKRSIHQEDIAIPNACTQNHRAPRYIKQKLTEMKGQVDKSTVIVGDFETPLLVSDRANRWPISKDIENLDYTINQLDLTGTQSILNQ